MSGRNPRSRRIPAIRLRQGLDSGAIEADVTVNPWVDLPSTPSSGLQTETSVLEKIAGSLARVQAAAVCATSFGQAYDALVDLDQKTHAQVAGLRGQSALSKQQHVIVSCPGFDARLSFFWYSDVDRRQVEALTRVLLEAPRIANSAAGRSAAQHVLGAGVDETTLARTADAIRQLTAAVRAILSNRPKLRTLVSYLPEVTVDDVKAEFGIIQRGDKAIIPLMMMCWRGEL